MARKPQIAPIEIWPGTPLPPEGDGRTHFWWTDPENTARRLCDGTLWRMPHMEIWLPGDKWDDDTLSCPRCLTLYAEGFHRLRILC